MIDTEVKMGNWVRTENRNNVVSEFQMSNGWEIDEGNELLPIPITESWLLKFGFKHVNTLHDGTLVFSGKPYLYFKDGVGRISCSQTKIESIHELQNVYYWMNNKKELEFIK